MKAKVTLTVFALAAASVLVARQSGSPVVGNYLEVRSCDVYTGACIANSEVNLGGKEGMLVWSVQDGTWNGVSLAGLNVIAVVQTENTLTDVRYQDLLGRAVVIVDDRATEKQRAALVDFARNRAGKLIKEVVDVKRSPIQVKLGQCSSGACATVQAGSLLKISTRCLGGKDHLCGNEENYYPPLTDVKGAFTAYTELATFKGTGLNATWELTGKRSAYLATF
jgi:hypothetical protein